MKYITKEWYETNQVISFFSSLKVSKEARLFSEEYFRKLYKKKEKEWLSELEEVPKVQSIELYTFAGNSQYEDNDNCPLDYSKFQKNSNESDKVIYYKKDVGSNFNLNQEKKDFKRRFLNTVDMLKRNLPKEIIHKVADIRVLALNVATPDVKRDIIAYSKANEKSVDLVSDNYWKEFNNSFKNGEPVFIRDFSYHDCIIVSCRKKGKSIVIAFNNQDGFQTAKQIVFKNCSIIKQDKPLHGAKWLFAEIYKIETGYEIHVLLEKKELIDYIIEVTDVEYN